MCFCLRAWRNYHIYTYVLPRRTNDKLSGVSASPSSRTPSWICQLTVWLGTSALVLETGPEEPGVGSSETERSQATTWRYWHHHSPAKTLHQPADGTPFPVQSPLPGAPSITVPSAGCSLENLHASTLTKAMFTQSQWCLFKSSFQLYLLL